jgi:hypothetical protein
MSKKVNLTIYVLVGLAFLALGGLAFFFAGDQNPVQDGEAILEVNHIIREAGAAHIFVGLSCFWCAFNFKKSRGFHYVLLFFFGLLSIQHWMDYMHDLRPLSSGLVNSIPFFLFLLIGRGKRKTKPDESTQPF